jgi:hypothetical protein
VNQQRRRRQPIAPIVEPAILVRLGTNHIRDELTQSVEHEFPAEIEPMKGTGPNAPARHN